MAPDPHGCCPTYREHLLSISVSASATPTRKPQVAETNAKEAALGRDMDAYKRLRRNGVQPRGIDGSARIEKHASTEAQVEGRPA